MNILVKMISTSDQKMIDLNEQFKLLDKDGSGMIDAQELVALQNKGFNLPKEDIDEIIKQLDYFGNGKINYSEFMAATYDMELFLSGEEGDQRMKAVFK